MDAVGGGRGWVFLDTVGEERGEGLEQHASVRGIRCTAVRSMLCKTASIRSSRLARQAKRLHDN